MKRFITLLFLLLATACKPLKAAILPVEEEPLVFAVIPADDPSITHEGWDPVVKYLAQGLGREVELHLVPDYAAQVEALRSGFVDFARLGSSSYVIATRDGVEIEPIASAVKVVTGLPGYYGYIITRADNDDIYALEDLQGHTFAFTDPQSSSGYVVPSCALKKAGVEVGRVYMAGSHEAALLAVQNGTVDAGAIAQIRFDAAISEGVATADEFRIIWQSDLIPNVPIVVQKSMPPRLKEQLQALFVNMPAELMLAMERTGEMGYTVVTDAHYDIMREIEAFVNENK